VPLKATILRRVGLLKPRSAATIFELWVPSGPTIAGFAKWEADAVKQLSLMEDKYAYV
jgi:hypothetical protein